MTDPIQVDLSGPEYGGGGRPPPGFQSRWAWLAIGLGLGLSVSLLISISPGPGDPDKVGEDGATTTAPASAGIGGEVPGFPDGLNVVVSPGEGRAWEVLTWPLDGDQVYRSIPVGDLDLAGTARFDVSGHFLAVASFTGDELILQAGRANSFGIVASGITSFAWHDSNSADLAWTEVEGEELEIWISEDAGAADVQARAPAVGGTLSAFGDWGYAITEFSGPDEELPVFQTLLLGPDGEPRHVFEGWVVASHPSGLLLVERAGQLILVTTEDPDNGTPIRVESLAGDVVVGGEFSPSGDRVAVTSFAGVSVVDLESLDVSNHSIRAGSDSMAWTSDGRFLLVSGFRGVAVLDTVNGSISSILEQETTRAVAAIEIGGP